MTHAPLRAGPQHATEDALLDAALAHLRERGVDGLTIRSVAERGGCSHTTGYAYFASLDHLIAALFWRQVRRASDEQSPLNGEGIDGEPAASPDRQATPGEAQNASTESATPHLTDARPAASRRAVAPQPTDPLHFSDDVEAAVVWALEAPATAAADDPALARAAQRALLSDEPAVAAARDALGSHVAARLHQALGTRASTAGADDLLVAYSGAMLQASLGYLTFAEVPARVASMAQRLAR